MFAHSPALWVVIAVLALALAFSSARPATASQGEARYVVKPGDTLWGIASDRYGGDPRSAVWRLQQRNGLSSAALVPGMTLSLPP